jgi:hypothetical protein
LTRPKLKICLFSAPDRLLEHIVTRNMFLGDFARSYYFILVTRNHDQTFPILFQNLRLELVYIVYDK